MLATDGALELHVPPASDELSVVVLPTVMVDGPEMVPAPKGQLVRLVAHLEDALEARGYFRPAPKKPKMVDNLPAVLTRPGFTEAEIKVLRGVVASLDYFSPKEPRGAGYPERKAKADRALHDDGARPSRLAEPVLGLAKGKTRGRAPQDEEDSSDE